MLAELSVIVLGCANSWWLFRHYHSNYFENAVLLANITLCAYLLANSCCDDCETSLPIKKCLVELGTIDFPPTSKMLFELALVILGALSVFNAAAMIPGLIHYLDPARKFTCKSAAFLVLFLANLVASTHFLIFLFGEKQNCLL